MNKLTALATALLLSGCATPPPAPVVIPDAGAETLISRYDLLASRALTLTGMPAVTPAEQRAHYPVDMATLHLALHDALAAVHGRYAPYAGAGTPAPGALPEAAVAGAAQQVLVTLWPNRSAVYAAEHQAIVDALPAGPAREQGLAAGRAAADRVLALRADDGRMTALPPFVPGSGPGQFRGKEPIGRFLPAIKPFVLDRLADVRAPGPPALTSAEYARDFEEVKTWGGKESTRRTAEELDLARFHTAAPPAFWLPALRRFARTGASLQDSARLMARLYAAHADAYNACFESKYQYLFWRPQTAIAEADRDGNPATAPDPAWTPVLPTPNHPEYPSGHACLYGALAHTLALHYGTTQISVSFDSPGSSLLRRFSNTDALAAESDASRISGGMHFRFATRDGVTLGRQVAERAVARVGRPR